MEQLFRHHGQRCRKMAVLQAVISLVLGLIWRIKAFKNQRQCQFRTRNNSLSNGNNSNGWTTTECVHTGPILPWGADREHGRCKLAVNFLAFNFRHFRRAAYLLACSFCLQFFIIIFVYARAKIHCYRFFNFDLRRKLCVIKADQVG